MTTIHDIAKECGLSIASVSNAINDNGKVSEVTKHIVLEKAKQLGYVPNEVADI